MKRVGFIFGTRPEVIKCVPVILEAQKRGLETLVVFTGQHREMAKPILEFFGVEIDIDLDIMQPGQSLAMTSAKLLTGLEKYQENIKKCDVVMVQGDTTSAFIGGYFCFLNQIKIGHIEAGLRTHNLASPFPEEGNRQLLSKITDFHFTPTLSSTNDLMREKVDFEKIHNVGNTVIDALEVVKDRLLPNAHQEVLENYGIDSSKEYVLVTGHRRENFGQGFQDICTALKRLSLKYPELNFVYPVHLNPQVKQVVDVELIGFENIKLIAPQDYVPFVSLIGGARLIMTDSGGVQEEAPSFSKPLIVMRDTTERPEGVQLGMAKLCGTDVDKIISAFDFYYEEGFDQNITNPYGDGLTSKKILNTILKEKDYEDVISAHSLH